MGRCNTGFKFLCWGMVLQGFSGPLVKLACDSAEFGLAKTGYINAFREILSEKAVGVFIAAALPWRLRVAKVHVDLGRHGELAMPGHFRSTIPRQLAVEFVWELARLFYEGRDDDLGVLVFDICEHDKSRMPLDQRDDVTVVGPHN